MTLPESEMVMFQGFLADLRAESKGMLLHIWHHLVQAALESKRPTELFTISSTPEERQYYDRYEKLSKASQGNIIYELMDSEIKGIANTAARTLWALARKEMPHA